MDVTLRFAEADDSEIVAGYALRAGAGLFEFLLDGVLPLVGAADLLRLAVINGDSVLHYSNAVLAELRSKPVGMILCYAAKDYGIPPIVETLVPRARLDQVHSILTSRVEDSYYVNSLIVDEAARGKGVARLLLAFASALAEEHGQRALSLHAWADNEAAVNLYNDAGFAVVREIAVPPAVRLGDTARIMLLMKADLPLKARA